MPPSPVSDRVSPQLRKAAWAEKAGSGKGRLEHGLVVYTNDGGLKSNEKTLPNTA
jgi:hypothetical protein